MSTMTSTTAVRPFTYDTLLDMPDDGNRYEIIGGELFVAAAPGKPHQRALYRLARVVGDHVDERGLGEVYFAPVDVRLTPHDIVEPDLLFIRSERLGIFSENIVEGAPDLVVEVLSPSTRNRDLTSKLALYASASVREYWIADPKARTICLYALSESGGYRRIEPVGGTIESVILPGLKVDVDAIFAGLD